MYRRPSRKKELARRTFIYTLMATATIVLVSVFVLTMLLGYRFNFETRSVEQAGLVQYDSFPRGAMVSVDGKTRDRTQTKGSVMPGRHQFSMQLKGYEPWQKTLDIRSGEVTWLSYIRLVPTEKDITTVETIERLTSAVASPDKRYVAGLNTDDEGVQQLVMIDFRNSQRPVVRTYPIDTTELSGYEDEAEVTHSFSIEQWSSSSRTLTMKHRYKTADGEDRTEWLWVDRESPAELVNLSRLFGLTFTQVLPFDSRDVYLLQDNGDVRRGAVASGVLSRPLVSRVISFDMYGTDKMSYVGRQGESRVAGLWQDGWAEPTIYATVSEAGGQGLQIGVSHYFHKDTVAVSTGSTVTFYRGSISQVGDGFTAMLQSARSFTLNRPTTNLQFSSNGRFIVAEGESGFVSYDLERHQASQKTAKYSRAPLRWLDSYYVWQVDEQGDVVMQEFDGVNTHELMPATRGYDALLTSDGRYVYSFVRSDDGVRLQRLAMVL